MNREISVCVRPRGGAGSCPRSSNLNYLLKVRVNRGALKLKDDFCATRTTFGVGPPGNARVFIFGSPRDSMVDASRLSGTFFRRSPPIARTSRLCGRSGGLRGQTKYKGLAESGAVLDPHIISRNLGAAPPSCSAPPRSGRGGRRFKSCHSDQYLVDPETAAPTVSPTDIKRERYYDERWRFWTRHSEVRILPPQPGSKPLIRQ